MQKNSPAKVLIKRLRDKKAVMYFSLKSKTTTEQWNLSADTLELVSDCQLINSGKPSPGHVLSSTPSVFEDLNEFLN